MIEVTAPVFGVLSILPVIVVFTVGIITKRTNFSMLCGVITGSLIVAKGLRAFPETFFGYLYRALSDRTVQWFILIVVSFGILAALFERSGAVIDLGLWISRFLKTQKQVLLGTFLFGAVIFIDDYFSTFTTGTVMRRIADRLKIPRTQLAYVVNSTAGPFSLLIPLSTWTAAYMGAFEAEGILVNGSAFTAFVHAIPLIFFPWVALIVCLLQIFGVIPKLGRIRIDYIRAERTGILFPGGSISAAREGGITFSEGRRPLPWNVFIPLGVVIAVTLLTNMDMLLGVCAGTLFAFLLYVVEKKAPFMELLTACFEGIFKMGMILLLFVLAWGLKNINQDTGMIALAVSAVNPLMQRNLFPMIVFIAAAVYAFFTGMCWDLVFISMPILVPLTRAIGVDPIFMGAAVFSGALFGNIFCPYGDGVVMCAQACEIRPIDLVSAIAPYILLSGVVTAALYLVMGFIL